jgi:acyl dehydratase
VDRSRTFDEIRLGDRASLVRTWTEIETARCARLIGDANPLHLDEAYCQTTRFGRRIVHGVLTASMIPTLAGTCLPGPGTIGAGFSIEYVAPVFFADTVTLTGTVVAKDPARHRITLEVVGVNQREEVVLRGRATVVPPRRPAPPAPLPPEAG